MKQNPTSRCAKLDRNYCKNLLFACSQISKNSETARRKLEENEK